MIGILLLLLMMGLVTEGWAQDSLGEKVDKFVEISGGYHGQRLSVYKNNFEWMEDVQGCDLKETLGDCIETKVNFGWRKGDLALILGIGCFGEVRTEWEWSTGGDGYAAFDSYFADLTLRRYLMGGEQKNLSQPKGILVYGEGGLGLYATRWRFEDENIIWTDGTDTFQNPKAESSDLGWHLGGGFECYFTPEFSIDLEALYRWIYLENAWRFPDSWSPDDVYYESGFLYFRSPDRGIELDLSGISATLGLVYHF